MGNITKNLWKHRNKIILVTAIILAFLYIRQCGEMNYQSKKSEQNIKALNDKVDVVQLKNGDLLSQKATLIASGDELGELNDSLKKEYDILKEEKSNPKVIIKTVIVYRDTGYVDNSLTKLDTNKYSLKFSYIDSDGILTINGRSEFTATPKLLGGVGGSLGLDIKPGKTFFDSTEIKLDLVLGVKEDSDGVDRIFAKSAIKTNKIKFDNLNAVQVEEYYKSKYINTNKDKKKDKVSVGMYVGYGMGVAPGGVVVLTPNIGLGVTYKLFNIPFL